MNSRLRNVVVAIGIISLLCAFMPMPSDAALIWSDDFNDLSLDDWFQVSCTAEDGSLRGSKPILDIDPPTPLAYHPSTVSSGTWKFDLTEIGEWGEELDIIHIYFITTDILLENMSYYAIAISHGWLNSGGVLGKTFEMELVKQYQDGREVTLDTHSSEPRPTQYGVLYQFVITRTTIGEMSVYINGTLAMSAINNELTYSEEFCYYSWRDYSLDNIEVYDSIEVGNYQLPLITLGIAASVGIIVVLIIIQKRR